MNGWSAKDVTLSPGQAISGVVTNQAISVEGWPITAGGAVHLVVKVKASGVVVVGAITAKLRTAIGSDYEDSKTVSISGSGSFYIKLNVEVAGDQTFLPLLNKGQIVITTTNAGDMITVDSVDVLQAL